MVRKHHDSVDRERVSASCLKERGAQQCDIVGEQPQPALGQIHREEIEAAATKLRR